MIETLGEAKAHGWRIVARCAFGKRESIKSTRNCVYRYELDLHTLIWTRGATFPISMLESRLKCPCCGSRRVVLIFIPPANVDAVRA
jgi:hypothetical protein